MYFKVRFFKKNHDVRLCDKYNVCIQLFNYFIYKIYYVFEI